MACQCSLYIFAKNVYIIFFFYSLALIRKLILIIKCSFFFVESSTIKRLIVLCFVSSATSVAIVGTHIYSAVGVFGVYSNNNIVDAWPWWILQTCLRIEELVSVCVVLTIASNSGHLKQLLSRCGSVVGHCFRGRNQVQEISIQQEFNKNCNLTKDETITKSEFYSEKL